MVDRRQDDLGEVQDDAQRAGRSETDVDNVGIDDKPGGDVHAVQADSADGADHASAAVAVDEYVRSDETPSEEKSTETIGEPGGDDRPDLLTLAGDVLQQPDKAFAYLARPDVEHMGHALLIYLASRLASALFNDPRQVFPAGFNSPTSSFVGYLMLAVLGLVVISGIVHGSARMLGGQSRYGTILQTMAMAMLPMLLLAPVGVLRGLSGPAALWGTLSTVITIWVLALTVVAIKEVYQFSTGRAIATIFFFPLLFIGIFFFLAVLGIVALMM